MSALRDVGYGISLGPLPLVVWIGLVAILIMIVAAALASLKKQVPLFRKVSVRAHRAMAGVGIVLALAHLVIGLSAHV